MNTQKHGWRLVSVSILGGVLLLGMAQRAGTAESSQTEYGPLLAVLSQSKLTLANGITQAAAKVPETAISAKFEIDDQQQLSLSVYIAEKGLETDAEHNVLKELAGSPAEEKWHPEVEVFEDAAHLKRAAAQLTLMALSPHGLLDIVAKAEKDHPGTIFSITPIITRANALENNVRLYKVVHGKRQQFAGAKVQVSSGAWHRLKLAVQGAHFNIFFDDKLVLEATDETFKGTGKVGLWTKADSVASFDNLSIRSHDTR